MSYNKEIVNLLQDLIHDCKQAINAAYNQDTKLFQMQEHLDTISYKANQIAKSELKD